MENITILCKDFELTDSIKHYLNEKMTALLHKYFAHIEAETSFNARLGKVSNNHNHGKIFYAEVAIHTPEKNFGSRVEADDIHASIDLVKDELAHNITHYKDKIRTVSRKEAQKFKQEIRSEENDDALPSDV